ncbi:MAG TPA: LysM peptidoglycan-binding domain-containing protein [Mycobacteriales bacterium]|nr:LysM peptidoglycan-binding domain-containing protein [Mycobacteriales bacterium]
MSRPTRGLRAVGLLVLVAAAVTAGAPNAIRIRPGDTLSELAQRHRTTVATLQALNDMGGSTTIYAGATLRVPGTAGSRATAPRTVTRPTLRTTVRAYTVRPGDGLIVVARRLHTTPAVLTRLNGLRRDYLILGESLRYPTSVRVTTTAPRSSGTVAIPGSVAQSAAAHRAMLRARPLPTKAQVQQMVARAARRHGVPASLALALAYQESGFQQRVVSPVDAIGAMQVLPSTGASLGRLHGRTFDLLKASDNVEAGVILLRDLLQATGSVEKALAGYYQGLGSIRRVGLLPQTKQYIRNVQLLRHRFS